MCGNKRLAKMMYTTCKSETVQKNEWWRGNGTGQFLFHVLKEM